MSDNSFSDIEVTLSFKIGPELLYDMRRLVGIDGEEELFTMLKQEVVEKLTNFPNIEFKFYYDKEKYNEYIKDKPQGCMS